MHPTPSTQASSKGRLLIWGRPGAPERDSRDLTETLERAGWQAAFRNGDPGMVSDSDRFDVILAEDPSSAPPERLRALGAADVLLAAVTEGAVTGERLAAYDVIFCSDPRLLALLRGLGRAVHLVPAHAFDRAERLEEILERHLRSRRERHAPVDWSRISYGHAEISRAEVRESMTRAWQSEDIPARQRALVQTELAEMYRGRVPKVYRTLAEALRPHLAEGSSLLEIGCASGYYYEILEYLLGRRLAYEGVDYSEALIRMARRLYPRAAFHVADGAALPFPDGHFPAVVSSCVLLHVPNWADHVRETARVAGRIVVAHRTPVLRAGPTRYLRKYAYGVETMELIFNEQELVSEFRKAGLRLTGAIPLDGDEAKDEYCITYVFEKVTAEAGRPEAGPAAGEADAEDFETLLRRGEAAFQAGELAAAHKAFGRAARIAPDDLRLLNDQAVLALEKGELEKSLEHLRRACVRDPMHRLTLLNLGGILSELGQVDVARPLLKAYLASHPSDADVRKLLGEGATAPAAPAAATAPASAPPLSVAWRNRPDMLAARGGDGTVIEETIKELNAAGHRAVLRLDPAPDLSGFDVVHLNNISRSQDTLEHLRHARAQGRKVVLTPLYEDMDRYLRPSMRTDLLFRYLAAKQTRVPLEALAQLRDSFELDRDPLDDPLARQLGIGDPVRQKAILDGVDLILTSGRRESDSIRAKFAPVSPITELHYGFNRSFRDADPRLFAERHGLRDFVLCVGRLEPRKNQWQLIEIFRSLPRLKLVLIGIFSDPSMEPLIKAYAPANVIFLDRLPLEELASAFAAARLHVLPSWYELPGLVSLEAAAAGSRVATTDWGSARDYFGDFAHYLPPDDPVRMRAVILEAFDSAPKVGLREHVLGTFSWQATARAAAEAYRRVIA